MGFKVLMRRLCFGLLFSGFVSATPKGGRGLSLAQRVVVDTMLLEYYVHIPAAHLRAGWSVLFRLFLFASLQPSSSVWGQFLCRNEPLEDRDYASSILVSRGPALSLELHKHVLNEPHKVISSFICLSKVTYLKSNELIGAADESLSKQWSRWFLVIISLHK